MKFQRGKLSIKPDTKWFEQIPDSSSAKPANPDVVTALKAEAQNLLDSETKLYHKLKENQRDKDFLWIKKILQAGTLSDKVSAHTLLVQDLPVYNIHSIETLVEMVNTKGKRECLMAMETLQDLFSGDLLIEERKLKPFNERPLEKLDEICGGDSALRKQYLILYHFEDQLKILYKKFLTQLEAVSHDTIEKTKMKSISVMARLLKDNGEEEQFLLEKLVNKMGDPIPKVGSHVCHQLGSILSQHDKMKTVVIQEVERLVFRPNLSERAKYYALCFLNQIILSHEESQLANHLITIYFSQFKLFVKKGEVDTKMMSALLTGVARAYPYAKLKDNVIITQLDAMYRLVHMVSFNIAVQAMMLIFQVLNSSDSVSDRFYGVLYRKLLDPALASSSRQALFLSLVYRALKKDVAVIRVKAFVKRLLQISLCQPPNLQCGILVLISELNKVHSNLLEVKPIYQADSESEEHYEDALEESDTLPDRKDEVKVTVKQEKKSSVYDVDCRNPLHTKASFEKLWELLFLKQSFHPSVCLFSHQISNSTEIKYSGDPLLDFTTSHFLDRFVYRNPKKPSESFRSDPKARVFGKRKLKDRTTPKVPVTSQEFLQMKESRVPTEEQFLYRYLQQRAANNSKEKDDSDMESVCSEDFEKLLDGIHHEDEGKDSLNFAKELGLHKQKKAAKRKGGSDLEAESDDDLSNMAGESDFEDDLDLEGEDFDDAFEDIGNGMEICEDDFIGEDEDSKPKKKNKGLSDENLLADADEFSALIEEGAGGDLDTLTSEAFKTKDKTSIKQLHWETERDRFIKGKRKPKVWKKKSKKPRKA